MVAQAELRFTGYILSTDAWRTASPSTTRPARSHNGIARSSRRSNLSNNQQIKFAHIGWFQATVVFCSLQVKNCQFCSTFCAVHEFHAAKASKSVAGIFFTNAIATEGDDFVLCHMVGRFNSSCQQNAVYEWCDREASASVRAVWDIAKGEEICIFYGSTGDLLKPRRERQEFLRYWGFTCACSSCMDPLSDERRARKRFILDDSICFTHRRLVRSQNYSTHDHMQTAHSNCVQLDLEWHGFIDAMVRCLFCHAIKFRSFAASPIVCLCALRVFLLSEL